MSRDLAHEWYSRPLDYKKFAHFLLLILSFFILKNQEGVFEIGPILPENASELNSLQFFK